VQHPRRSGSVLKSASERRTGQGITMRRSMSNGVSPGAAAAKESSMRVRSVRVHPNKRLKLTAHVN
jgi:hypothetical protein